MLEFVLELHGLVPAGKMGDIAWNHLGMLVHFTFRNNFIPGINKPADYFFQAGFQIAAFPVVHHPVFLGIQPREHGNPAGHADRGVDICTGEFHPLISQGLQVGSQDFSGPVGIGVIITVIVGLALVTIGILAQLARKKVY